MVKSLRPHAGEISRLWLVNGHWSWPLIGWRGGAWGDPHRDNCKKWHWQICMQRHASPESSSGLTNGMKNSMIHLLQYISPEVTFRWKYCLNIAEHCTDVYVWDSHLCSLLDVSSEGVCLSVALSPVQTPSVLCLSVSILRVTIMDSLKSPAAAGSWWLEPGKNKWDASGHVTRDKHGHLLTMGGDIEPECPGLVTGQCHIVCVCGEMFTQCSVLVYTESVYTGV